MADVFLSYSRDDQPTARRFAESLQLEDFTVWWDQSLNAGEAFDRVTEQALDEAKAVVVLWSRKSADSRWVRAEATQAQASGRLVPVMIEACRRPIMFELTHTADLSAWDGDTHDAGWRSFIEGLRRFVVQVTPSPAGTGAAVSRQAGTAIRRAWRRRISWPAAAMVAAIATAAGGLIAWWLMGNTAEARQGVIRVSLPFSGGILIPPVGARSLAISTDGSRVAFAGAEGLQIRSLHSIDPVRFDIRGTNPFFSPDGQWVGIFAQPELLKVPVAGGQGARISQVTERGAGASWGRDGTIVFATTEGLFRVAQDGGEPALIAAPRPDRHERLYAWPELLPGEQTLLYTILDADLDAPSRLAWLDLRSGVSRVVLTGGSAARYASTGHIIYAVGQQLHAIAFDAATGESRGISAPLSEPLVAAARDNGAADFAFAANGTLIFRPPVAPRANRLVWVDRKGARTPLAVGAGNYAYPRISPDGGRVALDVRHPDGRHIWVVELQRSSLTQLTSGSTEDMLPVWSIDGRRVFFASTRAGTVDVYSQAADGSSEAQVVVAGAGTQIPQSLTRDGRQLIVYENFHDVSVLDLGSGVLRPLLKNEFEYWVSAVSPDGRWLAYESKESGGQTEIFVRPFPNVSARREKISAGGGRYPVWSTTGSNELFYLSAQGEMMSARIESGPELRLGKVTKLFDWLPPPPALSGINYDVSPLDGRFLMVEPAPSDALSSSQVSVVLNWFDTLRSPGN